MRVLVPVLVLLLAWTSFSHADRSITTIGGVKVDLVGESGQIKLTAANSTSWTKLKWAKMEEIALNGNVLQSVNNFASQKDLDWAAPTQIAGPNGSTQTTITLAGPITVGNGVNAKSATLNVVVSLFSESVEVANGNTTVRVDVNNIKFDVRITNWPFQSDASRLAFGVTLQSQGGKGPATTTAILDDTTTGTSKAKRVTFGPGNIISPTNAIVDGVDKTINVTYTGETLTWIFPYFNSTLKYDPTMYAADTSSNSGTMVQPLVTASVLTALVVAVFHA